MDLNQFLLILKARRATISLTFAITVLVAVAVTLMLPKVYKASATFVVNSSYVDPVTGVQMQGMLLPAYVNTQVDVITSHSTALRVVKALDLAADPKNQAAFASKAHGRGDISDWLADGLLHGLKVEASQQSNGITISFPSDDPKKSADMTNAFVDAYVETSIDLKTQPAKQTAAWYAKQIKELRVSVEAAKGRLADYQNQYGVVLGSDQNKQASDQLQAIVTQHALAQAQGYGDASKAAHGGDSAGATADPVVQAISTSLAEAQANVSRLAQTEGANNPEYQSAVAAVDSLRQRLNNQIAAVHHSAQTNAAVSKQSEAALRDAVSVVQKKVLADKEVQDRGQILVSDVDDAEKLYATAVSSYKQNELMSKAEQTDVSVLNRAFVPNVPAGPSVMLSLLVSAAVGALLGIAYALALELMDRKIRSEQDLAGIAGLPLLGLVVSQSASSNKPFGWWNKHSVQG